MEPFKFKYLRGSFAKNRSLLFVLIFLKHVWCLQSEEYQSNWSGMVVRAWVGSGSGLYFSSATTTRAGFIVRQWKWPTNAPGNKMWRAASSSWWPRCKCKGTNGGAPARNALHVFHPPARWKGENGARVQHQITAMLFGKRTAYCLHDNILPVLLSACKVLNHRDL